MRRMPRSHWATVLLIACIFAGSGTVNAESLTGPLLLPISVREGSCECCLPTERSGEKYLLIVGSLARDKGPFEILVRTAPTTEPVAIPLDPSTSDIADQAKADPSAAGPYKPALAARYQPLSQPPLTRYFSVFLNDAAFESPAGYATVSAKLKGLGQHCQIYVDGEDADRVVAQSTIDDIVKTFDQEIYPQTARLGRVLDVDRDGRFTILLTHHLGRMARGKIALAGFVRGSDFYRDLAPPFSNNSDMMYLNSDLAPGPHLRTIIAHEYTHAIIFSEHVFGGHNPGVAPADEESWLNEGLSHLTEDSFGYSWANLDYRVSAFLNEPERYQLVVPDYHAAGLWRSHGNRGAAYTFLRWCADCCGETTPPKLIQSGLFLTSFVIGRQPWLFPAPISQRMARAHSSDLTSGSHLGTSCCVAPTCTTWPSAEEG
jgi:hypothetical protein